MRVVAGADRLVIGAHTSLIDVAFAVCTSLDGVGTRAVLVGGSAATFYAPARTFRVMPISSSSSRRTGAPRPDAMHGLGYELQNGIYVHRENRYIVEFPPGPSLAGS